MIYATPKDALFDVGKYNKELERIVEERNITVNYNYNLVEIDGDKKWLHSNISKHTIENNKL